MYKCILKVDSYDHKGCIYSKYIYKKYIYLFFNTI